MIESNRRFFLAFVNHAIWSTLTVASRYLQVYAQPLAFDGQGVLATAKATSAILVFTCGHFVCPEKGESGEGATASASQDVEDADEVEAQSSGEGTAPRPSLRTKILFALLFGTVATFRAALNIASTKFTVSYYITTINSLTPIVISIADSVLLKADLPRAIWPCIIASFIGCATIGVSQSPVMARDPEFVFTSQDAVGCALQFASMCFSAAARILMKQTEHILSRNEAVQTNNLSNSAFPLLYTLVTNPGGWAAFKFMTTESFLAWTTISVLVYTIGSTGQMSLVRSMGPGMYSSLSALRVLGSALLSAVWLHEPVRNWLEWVGLFIIMTTMTLYTLASVDARLGFSRVARDEHEADKGDDELDSSSQSFAMGALTSTNNKTQDSETKEFLASKDDLQRWDTSS